MTAHRDVESKKNRANKASCKAITNLQYFLWSNQSNINQTKLEIWACHDTVSTVKWSKGWFESSLGSPCRERQSTWAGRGTSGSYRKVLFPRRWHFFWPDFYSPFAMVKGTKARKVRTRKFEKVVQNQRANKGEKNEKENVFRTHSSNKISTTQKKSLSTHLYPIETNLTYWDQLVPTQLLFQNQSNFPARLLSWSIRNSHLTTANVHYSNSRVKKVQNKASCPHDAPGFTYQRTVQ